MRFKKLKYCIFTVVIFVLLVSSAIYAASIYRLAYVEKFETEKVDIQIQEISAIKEGEDFQKQQLAEANKELSYIPRIINCAAECYIRVKVGIVMDGDCEQPINAGHIYGLGKNWVVKGDYFYYMNALEEGQYVDMFEGLHVPDNWEYGEAEGFAIQIEAEAVQSANFEPDFNRDMPWGAVELKEVASAAGKEFKEATPVTVLSNVEYESDGGFQCSTSELFDDFSGMMPGDCYEKTVNLKNSADSTLHVSLNIAADESVFNEKMKLKIFNGTEEIYSGTILAASRRKDLDIAYIPKGKRGSVTFRMYLPVETDNSYAEKQDSAIWELNVEKIPDNNVQTGDFSKLIPFAVVAAFALLLMLSAVTHNRKDKNEICN